MRDAQGGHPEVYRGRWARPLAGGMLLLGTLVVADAVSRGDGRSARVTVAVVVFVLAFVHAVAFRPAVAVDGEGVRLRNVIRDVSVPWPRLASVRTRWSLVVVTEDGRAFPAWAIAAGPAARSAAGPPARSAGGPAGGPAGRPGQATDAEAVRAAVLRRWEAWRASGRPASTAPVRVTWAWSSLAALAVGTVVLVGSLLT